MGERCASEFHPDDSDAARLLEVIGPKALAALQDAFGGKRIWIPKAGGDARCRACGERAKCVRVWHQRQVPVGEIARRLGVSSKTVYRVLGG